MKALREPVVVGMEGSVLGNAAPSAIGLFRLDDGIVGARFRAKRLAAGWSQQFLAEKVTMSLPEGYEITQSHISRLERNPAYSRFYIIYAVCDALGCTIDDLMENDTVEVVPKE